MDAPFGRGYCRDVLNLQSWWWSWYRRWSLWSYTLHMAIFREFFVEEFCCEIWLYSFSTGFVSTCKFKKLDRQPNISLIAFLASREIDTQFELIISQIKSYRLAYSILQQEGSMLNNCDSDNSALLSTRQAECANNKSNFMKHWTRQIIISRTSLFPLTRNISLPLQLLRSPVFVHHSSYIII